MIPTPDISQVYPKKLITLDPELDSTASYVSTGSLYLDGVNDYVDADGLVFTSGSNSYSFSFWFNTKDATADARFFGIKQGSADRLMVYNNSGILKIYTENGTGSAMRTVNTLFGTDYADGRWHHMALVVTNGTSGQVYIDGKPYGAAQVILAADFSSTGDFKIGSSYSGDATTTLEGFIAHFGVWEAALTQTQILNLMTATTYAEAVTRGGSTPKAYFLFETNATDSRGAITYDNTSSTAAGLINGSACSTANRARLPFGFNPERYAQSALVKMGRCASADGSADWLDGGSTGDHVFTGSFTISLWAKTTSNTEQSFVYKMSGGATGYQITFDGDQATPRWKCSLTDGSWQHAYATQGQTGMPVNMLDGQWRHVVLQADNGTIRAWIDGKVGETTDTYDNSVAIGQSGQRFTIAKTWNDAAANQAYVNGSFCHLKVWNIALSEAQILEQCSKPEQTLPTGATSANLISYWALTDYVDTADDSLNNRLFMDSGTAASHARSTGMEMVLNELPPCPQLSLLPVTSRLWFDGANDYVHASGGADLSSGGAIQMWVIPDDDTAGTLIENSTGGQDRSGLVIVADGQLQWIHYNSTVSATYYGKKYTKGSSFQGDLMHIVGVYEGSGVGGAWTEANMKLYVDGSAKDDGSFTNFGITGNNEVGMGARFIGGGSPSTFFKGRILNCAIWTGPLTSTEVTALYGGGVALDPRSDSGNYASSSDLAHYWLMDNQTTVNDYEGSKNLTSTGGKEFQTIPEGGTPGTTVFGDTQFPVSNKAVVNYPAGKAYIKILNQSDILPGAATGFTASVWVKINNNDTGDEKFFFACDTTNSTNRWYLNMRDDAGDTLQGNISDGGGNVDINGTTLATTDTWYHIAITADYDTDDGKAFINGVQVGSDADISSMSGQPSPDADEPLFLGVQATNYNDTLIGAMAFPKIYKRFLEEGEIKQLYVSQLRTIRGL